MSESDNPSIEERLARIELFQSKLSESFTMMAKSLSEMNEKTNVMLDILNTFSIMVSEDDDDFDDSDDDDDDIEDFEQYHDDDEDDDDNYDTDSDSTWVPRPDFWETEQDDEE